MASRLKTSKDINPFTNSTERDLKTNEISKYVKVDPLVNGVEDSFFNFSRNKFVIIILLILTIIILIWSIDYYTNYGKNGEGLTLFLFSLIGATLLFISLYVFTKIPNIYFDNISAGYIDQNRLDKDLQNESKDEFVKEYNTLLENNNIPNTENIDSSNNKNTIQDKLFKQVLENAPKGAYKLKIKTSDMKSKQREDGSYGVSIYQYMPI